MSNFNWVTQSLRASNSDWPSSLLPTFRSTDMPGHRCGSGLAERVSYRARVEFISATADVPTPKNPFTGVRAGPCPWSLRSG